MSFNIIHHRGEPQEAEFENTTVRRSEEIFVSEWGAMVKCTPYGDHFIFEIPPVSPQETVLPLTRPGPAHQCTCGSPAVVVPPGPSGMFVCLSHATYGFHTTSFVNKKNFKEIAGEDKVVSPKGGKRWV